MLCIKNLCMYFYFRKSLANDRLITRAIIKLNDITQLLLKEISLILCKVYWPSSVISIRLKWKRRHLTWHLGRTHRFLIKLRHYGINQLNLHKVPWYLFDWILFIYNSVIYMFMRWHGFQNNTLKDILLLHLFWFYVICISFNDSPIQNN